MLYIKHSLPFKYQVLFACICSGVCTRMIRFSKGDCGLICEQNPSTFKVCFSNLQNLKIIPLWHSVYTSGLRSTSFILYCATQGGRGYRNAPVGWWNTVQVRILHRKWTFAWIFRSNIKYQYKNCYRPQTKLQKGNVFTNMCQEFCPWGEVYTPLGRQADTPLGRYLPG